MDFFTNTEKKIAQYVLENYEEVLNCNITELADKAKVSDASVVRFCRSVGYKGYQEFKVNAARDVLPRDCHMDLVLKKEDDPMTICSKVFNSEISILSRTLEGIDGTIIEKAAELISKAGKVVFFGKGASLLVGKEAVYKLMKIGINAYVYEDMELQLMASSFMGKGDVAIGVSYTGNDCLILQSLQNAKKNGASTVALAGRGKNPISKTADLVIETAAKPTIFQSEQVSTGIAQIAVIDALAAIVAFKNYNAS